MKPLAFRDFQQVFKDFQQAFRDFRILKLKHDKLLSNFANFACFGFNLNLRPCMVDYRIGLCRAGHGPFTGGSTPSSGYVAIYLLMRLCRMLTVYGFGVSKAYGAALQLQLHSLVLKPHLLSTLETVI